MPSIARRVVRTLALALLLAAGGSARAAFMLQVVSSGGPGVLVTDDVDPDLDPTAGVIVSQYGDSLFEVVTTVGTSKPSPGSPGLATMSLANITVNAQGPGTLVLYLTDTGFNGAGINGLVEASAGGSLSGPEGTTITFQTFVDPGNAPFALVAGTSVLGEFGPGPFTGSTVDPRPALGLYSMTQVVTMSFTGPGGVSFEYQSLSSVPEPSSLCLAGLGLAVMASCRVFGRKAVRLT